MFDEEGRKIKIQEFPRNFENMSVEELEAYLQDLEAERVRAQEEIDKKRASRDAAANMFKS